MAIFEETRRQLLQLSLSLDWGQLCMAQTQEDKLATGTCPLSLFTYPCIAFLSCLAFKIIRKITIYMSESRAHERALRQNRQAGKQAGAAGSAGGTAGGRAGGGSQSTRQFQLQLRTSTDTQ